MTTPHPDLIRAAGLAPTVEYGVEKAHGMTAWLVDHDGGVQPGP